MSSSHQITPDMLDSLNDARAAVYVPTINRIMQEIENFERNGTSTEDLVKVYARPAVRVFQIALGWGDAGIAILVDYVPLTSRLCSRWRTVMYPRLAAGSDKPLSLRDDYIVYVLRRNPDINERLSSAIESYIKSVFPSNEEPRDHCDESAVMARIIPLWQSIIPITDNH